MTPPASVLRKRRQGLRRESKMTLRVAGLVVLAGWLAGSVVAEEVRPGVLRTPDERFANLPGFDFEPHYKEIDRKRDQVLSSLGYTVYRFSAEHAFNNSYDLARTVQKILKEREKAMNVFIDPYG